MRIINKNLIKNKRFFLVGLLLIILLLNIQTVFAGSWYKGTLHQHTGFSTMYGYDRNPDTLDDQCPPKIPNRFDIEQHYIGNTTSEIVNKAKTFGHSFITITDHSYCLREKNFTTLLNDCKDEGSFVCLPGEEVSTTDTIGDAEYLACTSTGAPLNKGEAHVGAIGIKKYINQTPFGQHCPDDQRPQKVVNNINDQGGISILNHPLDTDLLDFESINTIFDETGIEIWNEKGSVIPRLRILPLKRQLQLWVRSRLFGDRRNSWIFSGTDSHADPDSDPYQYVYLDSLNNASLKAGLKSGRHVASNNGYIDFTIGNAVMGQSVEVTNGGQVTLNINWNVDNSCKLDVIMGDFKSKREFIVKTFPSVSGTGSDTYSETVDTARYYRLECIGGTGGTKRIYSNPIWVDPTYKFNITNNGKADLEIYKITTNKAWLSTKPSYGSLNPIKPGQSKQIEVVIDYTKVKHTVENGIITIKSNSEENSELNRTVTVSKFGSMWSRFSRRGIIQSFWQAKLIIEPNETDNLELNLDWLTNDELSVNLTSPDGTIYTATGHPKTINISNPMNGTWIVTVSGNDNLAGLEFGTETDTKPSDVPPSTINFTDVRIGYVNVCEDYRQGLRVVMEGTESQSGDEEINITNMTRLSSDAFMVGLIIPNHNQWLKLGKNEVDIDETFAQTEAAQLLLDADVRMKKADQDIWPDTVKDAYVEWDNMIVNESYYEKITNKTDWYYPDFKAIRNVVENNIIGNF